MPQVGWIGIPVILETIELPTFSHVIATPALAAMGDAARAPALALLRDPRPWARVAGATVLGKIEARQDSEALVPLLADSAPAVRIAAATALGQLRAPVAPRLIPLLGDGNGLVRKAAAGVLGEIGDKAVIPALRPLLTDAYPFARMAAAAALARLGDADGIALLRAVLADSDSSLQADALRGLIAANVPDLEAVLYGAMDTRAGAVAREELVKRRDSRVVPILIADLQKDSGMYRVQPLLRQATGQPWTSDAQWRCWWALQGKGR